MRNNLHPKELEASESTMPTQFYRELERGGVKKINK